MTDFDMPPASAGFDARGGWLTKALAVEFGLSLDQAAGVVGNLGYESNGFATLQEISPVVSGSKGGEGFAMWTATRRATFELWCKNHNLSTKSDEGNYGYLLSELHGAYASTITALRRCTTLPQSIMSVGQTYEKPLGTTDSYLPGFDDRLKWGQRALDGAKAAPTGNVPPLVASTTKPIIANASVRQIQQKLVALGWQIAVDNSAGPQTLGAILGALSEMG